MAAGQAACVAGHSSKVVSGARLAAPPAATTAHDATGFRAGLHDSAPACCQGRCLSGGGQPSVGSRGGLGPGRWWGRGRSPAATAGSDAAAVGAHVQAVGGDGHPRCILAVPGGCVAGKALEREHQHRRAGGQEQALGGPPLTTPIAGEVGDCLCLCERRQAVLLARDSDTSCTEILLALSAVCVLDLLSHYDCCLHTKASRVRCGVI